MSTDAVPLSQAQSTRRQQLQADIALLCLTLIWGSTFVLVKDSVRLVPPFIFLSLRFASALVPVALVSLPALRRARRDEWLAGLLIGLFLFGGYAFQTVGLQYTTASKSAFLTGLSVVMVPIFAIPLLGARPRLLSSVGVVLATVGLALLSLREDLAIEYGDLLTLACAVSFALHIIAIGKFTIQANGRVLVALQLLVATVGSALCAVAWEPIPRSLTEIPVSVISAALFLGLVASAFAFAVQVRMQRLTSATHTALIFTMEPVFGALFAYALIGEVLTPQQMIGCLFILAGMIIAEIAP